MIFEALILIIFSYIAFKVYPSPVVFLSWFFVALATFLKYTGIENGLLPASYVAYIITLVIVAIITEGDYY